ncbi:MAG: SDR family NAD(P)-dependent oxidoreductase, partial [Janthinobacterium lividum]
MAGRLDGKVAIVTGGSSGIGRAIALLFATEGAHVVVADVTEQVVEGGPPVLEAISAAGRKADFVTCDVSQAGDVDALFADTVARHGGVDILVNNAAIRAGV